MFSISMAMDCASAPDDDGQFALALHLPNTKA